VNKNNKIISPTKQVLNLRLVRFNNFAQKAVPPSNTVIIVADVILWFVLPKEKKLTPPRKHTKPKRSAVNSVNKSANENFD
jgi:Na+/H+ antiporter NhaD/arsenite permease-like protein